MVGDIPLLAVNFFHLISFLAAKTSTFLSQIDFAASRTKSQDVLSVSCCRRDSCKHNNPFGKQQHPRNMFLISLPENYLLRDCLVKSSPFCSSNCATAQGEKTSPLSFPTFQARARGSRQETRNKNCCGISEVKLQNVIKQRLPPSLHKIGPLFVVSPGRTDLP